jgi:SAM-dependent MidA family methyltransferase
MTGFPLAVLDEVRRRGRVTFAEFMSWALYHPRHGYYARPGRTGRTGDFFTSVQVGGLFGRLLAESVVEMWDHLGSGRITLVELGASDGALASQILQALEEKGRDSNVSLHLVEKSAAAREAARRRLARFPKIHLWSDLESFEHTGGVEGLVYSNEFFDALPVHRVRVEAGVLRELYVVEKDGRLTESPGEPSTPRLAQALAGRGIRLSEMQAGEICLEMDSAVADVGRILARGFVLTADYGGASADVYREDRRDGTLRTFGGHEMETGPFDDVGRRDITADVDFGRLAALGKEEGLEPLIFAPQGLYLMNSGERLLRGLIDGNRDPSVAGSVRQLLHPDAMGERFHVLVQGKNVGEPELSGGKANRLRRLDRS